MRSIEYEISQMSREELERFALRQYRKNEELVGIANSLAQ